jgi:hypothetical protein
MGQSEQQGEGEGQMLSPYSEKEDLLPVRGKNQGRRGVWEQF